MEDQPDRELFGNRRAVQVSVPDGRGLGPAMALLRPRHRVFVFVYCTNGCNGAAAAREAGFAEKNAGHTASYLLHQPRILAAIREVTLQLIQARVPIYRTVLEEIAANTAHRDQIKAALALISRGGLIEATEHNINLNVTLTPEEKIVRIRMLAEKHGIPLRQVLGTVSDAEFVEEGTDADKHS